MRKGREGYRGRSTETALEEPDRKYNPQTGLQGVTSWEGAVAGVKVLEEEDRRRRFVRFAARLWLSPFPGQPGVRTATQKAWSSRCKTIKPPTSRHTVQRDENRWENTCYWSTASLLSPPQLPSAAAMCSAVPGPGSKAHRSTSSPGGLGWLLGGWVWHTPTRRGTPESWEVAKARQRLRSHLSSSLAIRVFTQPSLPSLPHQARGLAYF